MKNNTHPSRYHKRRFIALLTAFVLSTAVFVQATESGGAIAEGPVQDQTAVDSNPAGEDPAVPEEVASTPQDNAAEEADPNRSESSIASPSLPEEDRSGQEASSAKSQNTSAPSDTAASDQSGAPQRRY